ncbi:Protein CdcH [Lasiodiplodia hormozganensis]|uniref:Protein CdcH n=1 Tax=Lasiodiplodia hormozganensis TaxID=869390 RepID=A0AA39XUG4_9PEZI|nr:Protein CdcH [Lasiodiplodia hormozganensis]
MLSMFRVPSSSESFVDVTDTGIEGPASDSGTPATPSSPQPTSPHPALTDGATGPSQTDATNKNAKPPTKGGLCSIRTLYEGLTDDDGHWEWQAEYPADLVRKGPAPVKIPPNGLYAVVVHQRRTGLRNAPPLRVESVTVQSPHIKAVLAQLLADHPNAGQLRRGSLVLTPPFRELYDVWPAFEEAVLRTTEETENAEAAATHLRLLYDLTKRDVKRLRRKQLPLDRSHKVMFNTLFTVFRPGTVVYHKDEGQFDRFYKVKAVDYVPNGNDPQPFTCSITCASLELDGTSPGWVDRVFCMDKWSGAKKLTELTIFPAELHPEYEDVRARVLERGRKWEALREKPTVVEYEGLSVKTTQPSNSLFGGAVQGGQTVNGRVIIDAAAYVTYAAMLPSGFPQLGNGDYSKPPLTIIDQDEEDDEDGNGGSVEANDGYGSDSDSDDEESPNDEHGVETHEDDFLKEPLSDEKLLLASHVVYGFYLRSKTWVKLYIDLVKEVNWNHAAFDRLILPGNYKQLILAFVESQAQNRDVFDDIIEGKGQGIIMLLHGAPGLGKTLTAETVSDRLQKPLYSVQAGELGSNATDVEITLQRILDLAAKWDAVLLLDEADVFLEQRHHSDLERSKIVSVFLRLLEYYRGILFLTSNRVESFDEAFRSRIHLKINYPDLNAEAKIGIWKNFIEASRKKNGSNVSDANIKELAEYPLNGREIKNMVKTAQLLASREKWPLEMRHFKVCLDVMEDAKGEQGKSLGKTVGI